MTYPVADEKFSRATSWIEICYDIDVVHKWLQAPKGEGLRILGQSVAKGEGKFRNALTSRKSYYNQWDSVQSWLHFSFCSQAIRRLLMNGQKRPGPSVYSRLKSCSLFCMMFRVSKLVRTGKRFGFNPLNAELNLIRHLLALVGARHIVRVSRLRVKQWQLLSIRNSFPCGFGAGGRKFVT